MTHTLHRSGTAQSLARDYVWQLYHAKGVNDHNLVERLRQAIAIVEEVGSVNWGDVKSGSVITLAAQEIKARITEKSRIRGVFTSRGQVTEFLRRMRQADLGLCVIISGLLDSVFLACQEAGLKPHTINYSLGIFGRQALAADEDSLDITTMCGHHMVPDGLAKQMREKVRGGQLSPEEAAVKLASFCPCGIFNQERAAELLGREKKLSPPR